MNQEAIEPRFTITDEQIQAFIAGKVTGPGPLTAEFNARADFLDRHMSPLGTRENVYEYPWGVITEASGSWGAIWNFYAADVWRAGTDLYFDRFLSAWKNDADPLLEGFVTCTGKNFYISFDDGISCFGCISLGCMNANHVQTIAKPWIGDVLLKTLFPTMVARALNPAYKFPREWECY